MPVGVVVSLLGALVAAPRALLVLAGVDGCLSSQILEKISHGYYNTVEPL